MRDLDLATLQPSASYAGLWTDYARDTAYGDYTLSPGASGPEATTIARYQPGAWERQGDTLRVHHGDQIGSSRVMTDASAQPARRAVYTAFGELVLADDGNGKPPAASRDGYAGAWGYETGLDDGGEPDLPPLPFTHVGERWYDPSAGRFLQRDPIGIAGGLNVFADVESSPVTSIDPTGRFNDWAFGELPSGWKPGGLTSPPAPPSPPIGPPWPLRPADNDVETTTFLEPTGGRESWLDRPNTVKKVQFCLALPALFASNPFLPVPLGLQVGLWAAEIGLATTEAIDAFR